MARRRSAGGRKKNGGTNTSIFDGAEAAALEIGSSRSYHDISSGLLASITVGPVGGDGDGGANGTVGNYRQLDPSHVESLLRSIKEVGVTDPISVEIVVEDDGERDVVIVKGHHRTAAVLLLRKESEERDLPWLYRPLPCVVRVMGASAGGGDTARLVRQTTSNMVRQDSIWEKAEAYRGLRDGGKTQADIALIMGCDERTVGRHLALLGLPEAARKLAMGLGEDVTAKTMFQLAEAHRAYMNGKRGRTIAPKLGEREEEAALALVASEFEEMGMVWPPGEDDGAIIDLALAIGAEAARRRGLFRQGEGGGGEKPGEPGGEKGKPGGEGEGEGADGGGGAAERPAGRRRTREARARGEGAEIKIQPERLREVLAGEKVPEAVIRRVMAAIGG